MIPTTDPGHDFGAKPCATCHSRMEQMLDGLEGFLNDPDQLEARAARLRAENAKADATDQLGPTGAAWFGQPI
jgi:hypothetical protein